jgi:type IX secretion system PorP/SprF family membrane protein
MLRIKHKSLLIVGCVFGFVLSNSEAKAQDPEFTQFYANHLYLNPAFAGTHGCPRFNLNYRNQWPSLSGTFVTTSVSYDQYFKPMSGGIGVLITNDMQGQGTINTTTGSLIYSYHLAVNRKFSILFGAQATWNQKFLDWNKLTFGDQIDPRRGFIYQTGDVPRGGSRGFFDVSAGIIGYTKNFYAGFTAKHLNTPNESMILGDNSRLPMRFTAHVGSNIVMGQRSQYNNESSISPNIIWSYQQGFMQTNVGLYLKYGVFTTGVWFRDRDAFIVLVGLNTGKFRFGYSYDLTVSRLTNASGGSHEISLGFNLNCKEKPRQFRTITCPSF